MADSTPVSPSPMQRRQRIAPSACGIMSNLCADSTTCPPFLVQLVNRAAASFASSLPARIRRRKRGCGTRDHHQQWLNMEPCGLLCAGLVWVIVLYCASVVNGVVLLGWYASSPFLGWLNFLFFNLCASLALASHARAMLSNPGACPVNSRPTHPSGWNRTCQKCNSHKPERAHHCSICGRCVIKMDRAYMLRVARGAEAGLCKSRTAHSIAPLPPPSLPTHPHSPHKKPIHADHCPWVNNCVGLANHKFFLLFLLYIHTISVHALILVGAHMWACFSAGAPESCGGAPGASFVAVLTMCVLAGLFGLFTLCMMVDQSSTLTTGLTQIDRHHASRTGAGGGAARPLAPLWHESFAEVVGGDPAKEGFSIFWLLPTPITYLNAEALTGYCFRDTPRPRSSEEMEALL